MLPLATEENRRLLDQSQLVNQQMTETVERMRAQLQQAHLPFYAHKNRRELAIYLNQITDQLAQQHQSQQQIQQQATNQSCTASNLILHRTPERITRIAMANHSSNRQREWSLNRSLPIYNQPPRIIGCS